MCRGRESFTNNIVRRHKEILGLLIVLKNEDEQNVDAVVENYKIVPVYINEAELIE